MKDVSPCSGVFYYAFNCLVVLTWLALAYLGESALSFLFLGDLLPGDGACFLTFCTIVGRGVASFFLAGLRLGD